MTTPQKRVIKEEKNRHDSLDFPLSNAFRWQVVQARSWIIAATGLAVVVFIVISSVSSYVTSNVSSDQAGSGQNFNDLLTTLAIALLALAIFFFFLILSAVELYLST